MKAESGKESKYEETREVKKEHAILIGEDNEGLIGLTSGDFAVHLGPAEAEVTIDDIPIKLGDVPHTELKKVKCISCDESFWVREDANPVACPFCDSKAIWPEESLNEPREAQKRIEKEEIEQLNKDQEVLEAVKEQVSIEFFGLIEDEITESEHTTNYRILDEPIGDLERAEDIKVWVDQHPVGVSGDSWAGVVCVELPDGKYLAWDYWM